VLVVMLGHEKIKIKLKLDWKEIYNKVK